MTVGNHMERIELARASNVTVDRSRISRIWQYIVVRMHSHTTDEVNQFVMKTADRIGWYNCGRRLTSTRSLRFLVCG